MSSEDLPEKPKRKPVLFDKGKVLGNVHARRLNTDIRSNRWGKDKNVLITYQKANGDVVQRKVRPMSAKGHLLIAHDHLRDNIRSFHIDRIQKMEKSAFEAGFEKRAGLGLLPVLGGAVVGGLYGSMALPGIASIAASHKFNTEMAVAERKKLSDFEAVMKEHPEVAFLSDSDLANLLKKAKLAQDRDTVLMLRHIVSKGNNAGHVRMPGISRGPNYHIVVPDRVNESVLGHEIGHYLTKKYMETSTQKERDRIEGSTLAEEEEAWKRSPLPVDEKIRDAALGTYKAVTPRTYAYGALGGAALGALGGALIALEGRRF